MMTTVSIADDFAKDLKRLDRHYPDLTSEVLKLIERLENGEQPGDRIPRVSYPVYKVRIPNPNAGKGKRGGARVVYVIQERETVILIALYAKNRQTDISPQAVMQRITKYLDQLPPSE